jgi:predicted dehydrogenase
MAATLWDAVSMTELAKSSGVPAVVNFGFPELPAFRVARAALATLVPLRSVAVQWNIESRINATRLDHWKASAALGGGTLANFVAHSLHYLEWFLGPLESLQAELATAPGDPRTGDTFAALVFRFASGVAGSLSVSAAACGGSGHAIEFSGEGGTVLLRNPTHDPMRGFVVTRTSRDGHCETLDAPSPDTDPGEDSRLEPTRRIAKRLIDWVLAGTPATPNFAAGLRVQALLSAAREGAHDGRRIDLRELALT